MKNYSEFLFESNLLRRGTKQLSEKQFNKLLFDNCKEFLDNPKMLCKNSKLDDGFYYTNPKSAYRYPISLNIVNLTYDYFFANSKEWKDYPKRSNSVICYNYWFKEGLYGANTFNVIPYDNSKWVVCNRRDFWHTFSDAGSVYSLFSGIIRNMNEENFIKRKEETNQFLNSDGLSKNDIDKNLHKDIIKSMKKYKAKDIVNFNYINVTLDENDTIYDALSKILKPEGNVELMDYNNLKSSDNNIVEVYTDSKCLYAPYGYIKKIINK